MLYVARFLAAGTVVTIASLASRRFGPALGGMLLAFPFVIGTGLVFAAGRGTTEFRTMTTGVLWGLFPLLVFTLVVLVVSRFAPPLVSLGAGATAWVLVAGVLQWLR